MLFKRSIVHLTVMNRNLGDNALNLAIRRMLSTHFRIRHIELLNNPFHQKTVSILQKARAVIFGGGGLFHSYGPSGTPWSKTGTMWNMDIGDIRKIRGPIILYGVGFNHFFGDPPPLPAMHELLEVLIEKDAMIAFRNDGSRNRLFEYFPQLPRDSIGEIPDPGFFFTVPPKPSAKPYVVIQIAADRIPLRYGDRLDEVIQFINKCCAGLNYDFYLIAHTIDDVKLYQSLNFSFPIRKVPFSPKVSHAKRLIGYYAGAAFSITLRGHGQICSLGNGLPNFSIATHPKIIGFSQATRMDSYCHHFGTDSFDAGINKFRHFVESLKVIRGKIENLKMDFDIKIKKFNQRIINRINLR